MAIEAEYTQQFLFLPAPLDGFGIDSNLTYNQSSAQITRTRDGDRNGNAAAAADIAMEFQRLGVL